MGEKHSCSISSISKIVIKKVTVSYRHDNKRQDLEGKETK